MRQAAGEARLLEAGRQAEHVRHVLAQIEALPPEQAATLICERAEAERQANERTRAEREACAAQLRASRSLNDHRSPGSKRDAPRL